MGKKAIIRRGLKTHFNPPTPPFWVTSWTPSPLARLSRQNLQMTLNFIAESNLAHLDQS